MEFQANKKGAASLQPLDIYSLFGSACWARTSDPMINSQRVGQLIGVDSC